MVTKIRDVFQICKLLHNKNIKCYKNISKLTKNNIILVFVETTYLFQ